MVQSTTYSALSESFGTQIKAVVIEFEGSEIPFQFQLWNIREKSVCANVGKNVEEYSQCTIKAAKLFNSLCGELTAGKTRDMYCNAAVTYKPTRASIQAGTEVTALDEAKSACNKAIIEAMASNTVGAD